MLPPFLIFLERVDPRTIIGAGLTYSIAFAGPGNLLVNYIKKLTGIDVYDFPKKFDSV